MRSRFGGTCRRRLTRNVWRIFMKKKKMSIIAFVILALFALGCIFGVACDRATTIEEVPKFTNPSHVHTYVATYDEVEGWTYVCSGCGDVPEEVSEDDDVTYAVTSPDVAASALEMGSSLRLENDIEFEGALDIEKDVTLDLGESTLSSAEAKKDAPTVSVARGATLTIKGEGTIENSYSGATSTDNAAAVYTEGTVIVESGTISSESIGIKAEDGADVTIEGGEVNSKYFALWLGGDGTTVSIEEGEVHGENKGIVLCGDGNYGHDEYQTGATQTLNVSGGELSCENDSVICTLGITNAESSVINITGGELRGADVYDEGTGAYKPFPTIYIACGTLKISGGTIYGSTPVEIRGGTATISGGVFVCTAKGDAFHNYNSSGATSYGYALAVFPYGEVKMGTDVVNNGVSVMVFGGTFFGEIYGATEEDYTTAGKTGVEYTFEISGGSFEEDPSSYLAGGYEAVPSADESYYVVMEKGE